MGRPAYLVFAGVNGAGKSTFFRTGFWEQPGMGKGMPRVNADEILRERGGDPSSEADQLAAGKEAVRRIEELFAARRSFNQETTLTGRASVRNIRRAWEMGYRAVLYYIGLESPAKAFERIVHRVEAGGHPVPEEAVRRRYEASLRNLSRVLDLCETATVFDNTVGFAAVAQWTCGTLSWVGDVSRRAPWLLSAMQDEEIWRAG